MKNLGSGSGTARYKNLCWGGNADGLASPAEQVMGYVSWPTTSGQKMNQLLIALYCSYCQGLFFFFFFGLFFPLRSLPGWRSSGWLCSHCPVLPVASLGLQPGHSAPGMLHPVWAQLKQRKRAQRAAFLLRETLPTAWFLLVTPKER